MRRQTEHGARAPALCRGDAGIADVVDGRCRRGARQSRGETPMLALTFRLLAILLHAMRGVKDGLQMESNNCLAPRVHQAGRSCPQRRSAVDDPLVRPRHRRCVDGSGAAAPDQRPAWPHPISDPPGRTRSATRLVAPDHRPARPHPISDRTRSATRAVALDQRPAIGGNSPGAFGLDGDGRSPRDVAQSFHASATARRTSPSSWGSALVLAMIGKKLASDAQRGTMCWCRCASTPAPAIAP